MRESAHDKKAEAFAVLDVSGRTILADTFAIVTGRSKIQTRAIADSI
ncbi:MAG: RsfS/YbeB/iojap family protein, partial [Candidatus Eremiobacteraeota bacterium]|nr:RsfS/YbeB/iojap family protein [Candidatus Eremiobacteraeota bacterium]